MSRILIVDDEEGIRRSLAGILGDEGFDTTPASQGETSEPFSARRIAGRTRSAQGSRPQRSCA